jgi:hypothetical protein
MLKLSMKSNVIHAMAKPSDENLISHLLHTLLASKFFSCSFLEYFMLLESAMVQILGNIGDEHCFNSLAFHKSKLWNQFTTNLGLVVKMFSYKFYTMNNFLYVKAFEH